MSDIVITEEQFFKILTKLFNNLYKKVKYTKDDERLSVYYGNNKLVRYSSVWEKNNVLMDYYPKDESLWISTFLYSKIERWFPRATDNMLFYDFFKKWFSDKFGLIPKKVYITNEKSLNDRYHNQQLNKNLP